MPKLKEGIADKDIENELAEIKKKLPSIPDPWQFWIHRIQFGRFNSGGGGPSQDWRVLMLPKDYTNKSVLDIGGADGFYSFDAEDKGAGRIVISDLRKNIKREMALRIFKTSVEEIIIDVYDMDSMKETFDVIIFMGVLYHLQNPILGLEKVFNRLKEGGDLYLETLLCTLKGIPDEMPIAEFIENDRINHDITNWWAPTKETTLGMMRTVGFKNCKILSKFKGRGFFYATK